MGGPGEGGVAGERLTGVPTPEYLLGGVPGECRRDPSRGGVPDLGDSTALPPSDEVPSRGPRFTQDPWGDPLTGGDPLGGVYPIGGVEGEVRGGVPPVEGGVTLPKDVLELRRGGVFDFEGGLVSFSSCTMV